MNMNFIHECDFRANERTIHISFVLTQSYCHDTGDILTHVTFPINLDRVYKNPIWGECFHRLFSNIMESEFSLPTDAIDAINKASINSFTPWQPKFID
jgi:hypothetical protein